MEKYRILEITCFGGKKVYKAQKRLFGFLWWYNWLCDYEFETGIFDKLADAEEAVEYDRYKNQIKIVKTWTE